MDLLLDYKYLGLVAVLILIIGLILTPILWPQGKHKTFSQHVAVHRRAIIYYISLFTITLPLLLVFFYGWFVPTFELPLWFSIFVAIACLLQYMCTLIPESGGWKTTWHRAFAGLSAMLLVLPLAILAFSPTISTAGRVVASICIVAMLGIIWATRVGKGHPYMLPLQAAYYAAFFVPILTISYL